MNPSFRIPALADVLSEQRNLDALCRDRELRTAEICWFNAYYGMDVALKSYAGWPLERPLKVALTHGIQPHDYVWEAEIAAPVPAVLVYPEHLVAPYARKSGKAAFRAAVPYLYVIRLLDGEPSPRRKGTLFFLSHSSYWMTTRSNVEEIVQRLAHLPPECHPVNVCVYWRDHELGHHKVLAERGFQIFSAGHMYDPAFLFRLHHLCSLHKYACGTELGSHLFYAVKSGLSYFHLPNLEHAFFDRETNRELNAFSIPIKVREQFETMFSSPAGAITKDQMRLVDQYVGADCELPREELRAFLTFCERLDTIGVASWAGKRYAKWPQAVSRGLWHMPRRMAARVARKVLPAAARRAVGMRS